MQKDSVERRRGRRADVQASLRVRRLESHGSDAWTEETAGNVSLAGVYFETERDNTYAVNDVVVASVSVPEASNRQFPFTRVAGRSRVVRVHELTPPSPTGRKRFGVALEFGDDVTALSALPARG